MDREGGGPAEVAMREKACGELYPCQCQVISAKVPSSPRKLLKKSTKRQIPVVNQRVAAGGNLHKCRGERYERSGEFGGGFPKETTSHIKRRTTTIGAKKVQGVDN